MKATLRNGMIRSPFSLREHAVEDYTFSRMLHEKCFFRCPDTGNEFEIVVRKKVPDELADIAAVAPAPPIPADEPGTMGGTPFEPSAEEEAVVAQAIDDEEAAAKDEVAAEETEQATDEEEAAEEEEEEETTTESISGLVLSLVEHGMDAGQALDLVEMCGYDPTLVVQRVPVGLGMAGGIMGSGAPIAPAMIPGAEAEAGDYSWGDEPEMEP